VIFGHDSLKNLASEAKATLYRFPLSLVCASSGTAYLILNLKALPNEVARMVAVVALGIPLFLSMELFAERKHHPLLQRLLLNGIGVALLGTYYFCTQNDTQMTFWARYLQVSLSLHLFVAVSAFLFRDEENGFWQFNKIIFVRVLLSILYAGVLFAGLAACLLTFNYLFEIKADLIYARLWFFCVGIFQTWYFLSGVPKNSASLQADQSYPTGLKIFTQYLLIPLISLYMIILYLYMGKILLQWDLPKGYVGWLVSIMSVLGLFNLLLLEPVREKLENRWVRTYAYAFHILLIPLIGMLFVGIAKRLRDYGMTEMRYLLVVLAAWLLAISMHLLLGRRRNIKIVPLSLSALLFITSFGPWGAYTISKNNQLLQLERMLIGDGLLIHGQLQPLEKNQPNPISSDHERRMSSIFDYLLNHHGVTTLKPWFGESTISALQSYEEKSPALNGSVTSAPIMKALGLQYFYRHETVAQDRYSYGTNKDDLVDVHSYDSLYHLKLSHFDDSNVAGPYKIVLLDQAAEIIITKNDRTLITLQVDPFVKSIRAKQKGLSNQINRHITLKQDAMILESENEYIKVRLVINSLDGNNKGDSVTLESVYGDLLIHNKK
jgi:hypothetical protein